MDKIHEADLKFVSVDADADFDPQHNERVIEESIRKYEAERRRRKKEYDVNLKERTDALSQFLKSRSEGNNESIVKYFGQRYIEELRNKQN